MKENLKLMLVVIVSLIAGAYLHRCKSSHGNIPGRMECATDTLKVYDTIPYIAPKPQTELAIGTRRYALPNYCYIGGGAGGVARCSSANDTITVDALTSFTLYGTGAGGEPRCADSYVINGKVSASSRGSVSVDSAIVELPIVQRHYSDSTYEAWVSGPIDPQLDSVIVFAPTTIITKREWKPPKRWHIGPTIGYGYTPQGFQPYIGISITYSIISF